MNLAPNSTNFMEYLKRYSAKTDFVLTREVRWNLPTFATHYTTYLFVLFFPDTSRRAAPLLFLSRDPSSSSRRAACRAAAGASRRKIAGDVTNGPFASSPSFRARQQAPDSSGGGGGGEAAAAAARPRAGAALFAVSRLFIGFAAKRPSDGESSRSPTSPLDPKALLLRSPRSPRTWGAPGLVDALAGDATNCLLQDNRRQMLCGKGHDESAFFLRGGLDVNLCL